MTEVSYYPSQELSGPALRRDIDLTQAGRKVLGGVDGVISFRAGHVTIRSWRS